jgi:excisionase family DNA binding protein
MDREVMSTSAAAAFLDCTPTALYKLVSRRAIPYRKKGKKLLFLRSELTQFLRELPGLKLEDLATRDLRLSC